MDNDYNVMGMVSIIDTLHAIKENKSVDVLKRPDIMTRNPLVVCQQVYIVAIIEIITNEGFEMISEDD
ncbi:hypothetical protein [Candidatus Nitrosocosmicus sp. T]